MKRAQDDRVARGLWWDQAWSLVEGCTPVSAGCRLCWAAETSRMRARQRPGSAVALRYGGLTNEGDNIAPAQFNGCVRFQRNDLRKPFGVLRGRVWSVWNDLWHAGVSDSDIMLAFATMLLSQRHDYVVCTKRPERAPGWFAAHSPMDCVHLAVREWGTAFLRHGAMMEVPRDWPAKNVIGMTSCETQAAAELRLPPLCAAPFATRAVALAPLLGPVDWAAWAHLLDWCVVEEETGSHRHMAKREWFDQALAIAQAHKVPFFLKRMTWCARQENLPELDGRVWDQFPNDPQSGAIL
jgi:protein gp37